MQESTFLNYTNQYKAMKTIKTIVTVALLIIVADSCTPRGGQPDLDAELRRLRREEDSISAAIRAKYITLALAATGPDEVPNIVNVDTDSSFSDPKIVWSFYGEGDGLKPYLLIRHGKQSAAFALDEKQIGAMGLGRQLHQYEMEDMLFLRALNNR